jgi:hypothetical protein
MQIRRPIAALMTAVALFGGGVTMTACESAGQDQNDGTTDDSENTSGDEPGSEEQGDLPDNSNRQTEDPVDDDTSDPD